jgi:hypothetical protein
LIKVEEVLRAQVTQQLQQQQLATDHKLHNHIEAVRAIIDQLKQDRFEITEAPDYGVKLSYENTCEDPLNPP